MGAAEPIRVGMSLADLEALALQRNPTLVQAAAQIGSARARALQAGLPPNPIIGYIGEQIGAAGTPGETQGAFIQQEIVTGGKLRLSRAKYTQESHQAGIQQSAQQCRLLNGVRLGFYEVLAAQRRVEILRNQLQIAEEAVRATAEMLNVGQANQPDLLQAQVEAQRQRVTVRTAEARVRARWLDLAALVGEPDLPLPALRDELEPQGPPLDRDVVLAQILGGSPELAFVQAEVVRDQITVQRERAEPIPNVIVQANTGYNFEVRNQTATVQIGLNVPLWNRNQGTIREAQMELTRAQAEVRRVELELRRRFADAFLRYETAWISAEDFRSNSLPKARQAVELYQQYMQEQRAALPQVLVANRTYTELSEQYVDALLEVRQAEVELTGLLLVDGLTQPPAPTPQGHIESTPQPR